MSQNAQSADPIVADATKPYYIEPKWETVLDTNAYRTFRMAVAGGWIVEQHRRDLIDRCPSHALSICFVPDEKHFWKVTNGQ